MIKEDRKAMKTNVRCRGSDGVGWRFEMLSMSFNSPLNPTTPLH
jgi:hypothetical protein